ncbi:hypothetical protein PIB30_094746, partial [Stylosanthes scabra]|nr:hypothetical protein [Stylosanthes scabra]
PSFEFGFLLEVKIHALLADNQGNCARKQCLDELSGATPPFIFHSDVNVNFVDLGKGKVCILIGGYTVVDEISPPRPILCVLVLKLGFVQDEEEQWGQRFLSVEVPVNQVYDMLPYIRKDGNPVEVPQSSFVFSMPLKHSYSQDSNSPSPRKEPKLASGTNPSNPRALLEQHLLQGSSPS